jgi:hypothetical protein
MRVRYEIAKLFVIVAELKPMVVLEFDTVGGCVILIYEGCGSCG